MADGSPLSRARHPQRHTAFDLVLDVAERAAVLALFVLFVIRLLPQLTLLIQVQTTYPELIPASAGISAQALLLVVSETFSVVLILARPRSSSLSSHPFDWALCLIAVTLPLLVMPASAGTLIPATVVTALMLAGLIVQIAAKAALWRSFGILPANRGVKTGGPYRLLRHPMYAGYMVIHAGFLVGFPSLHNTVLYGLAFVIQIGRLLREETVLKRDPVYRDYAERVRYRLIPGVF
jgi:protein-S-isoprenylcysteine O-methyltransferase Ste14